MVCLFSYEHILDLRPISDYMIGMFLEQAVVFDVASRKLWL